MLKYLYSTLSGRIILKLLTAPFISKAAGCFMDSRLSVPLIKKFIKINSIDLSEVAEESWPSFNEFFTRRLVSGSRPMQGTDETLVSPCDGYLKAYSIEEGSVVTVKDVPYTIAELLRSENLAKRFDGGDCLVFRLTPSDYHRYVYPDSGEQVLVRRIDGVLHTVQPIATEHTDVFVQNSREYALLKTDHFGPVIMMEVGALLVGRITNEYPERHRFYRGEEKGYFEFGGSTIVLLLEKGRIKLPEEIEKASAAGLETKIRQGEMISGIKR